MVGGQVLAYLGGLHYWWSKMTGKLYSEFWSKIAAIIVFVGFNLTFFPQFILGYLGMPRRYASYPEELQVLNIFSTAGASILAIGLFIPLVYFIHSIFFGSQV
jgi:cytochrome c oxidase subunit 1